MTGYAEVGLSFAPVSAAEIPSDVEASSDAEASGERRADGAEARHASLTVRGSGAPGAREDWSSVLAGFARFTGGTVSPFRP